MDDNLMSIRAWALSSGSRPETVCASNEKTKRLARISPGSDFLCEVNSCQILAVFVHCDDQTIVRNGRADAFSFGFHDIGGALTGTQFGFDGFYAYNPVFWEASEIIFNSAIRPSGLTQSDSDDGDFHDTKKSRLPTQPAT